MVGGFTSWLCFLFDTVCTTSALSYGTRGGGAIEAAAPSTCGCVPASLCRPLRPQPPPRVERLLYTSRYLNESANDNGRLWDYLPWEDANITTVIPDGGTDVNKLACEAHRHG